ncbi:Transformer-2 -like protein beta [Sarcoptes scabiei]|nr:Transformer-2 -like protein beta [Sarcoptes scabiei]
MSDREDSLDRMDNGSSDHHDDRSDSNRNSDLESRHSANGHSPRPSGRSRSRSRSNSRRFNRKSRSRSVSKGRSRKHSRHSPESRSHRSKRSRSPSGRRRHVGTRENPPPGRCLGIFGLSIYTQERDLRDVFSKFGPIENVQIVFDAQTGRSRGFAFVYFEKPNHAADAKDRCNGIEIDGRKIRVDFSITQRAHTPTPGIYMGKPSHPRHRSGGRSSGSRGGDYAGGGRSYRSSYGGSYERRRSTSPYFRSERRAVRYSRSRSRSFSPHR